MISAARTTGIRGFSITSIDKLPGFKLSGSDWFALYAISRANGSAKVSSKVVVSLKLPKKSDSIPYIDTGGLRVFLLKMFAATSGSIRAAGSLIRISIDNSIG